MKNIFLILGLVILISGSERLLAADPAPTKPFGWWEPAVAERMGSHSMVSKAASPKNEEGKAPLGHPGAMGPKPASSMGGSPHGSPPEGFNPHGASPHGASPAGVSPHGASPHGASPAGVSPHVSSPHGASPTGAPDSKKGDKVKTATTAMGGHTFAMNRDPIHRLYLRVKGADQPTEAPEVYYRTTARTLARHGGVPLGVTEHRANVVLDNGVWRADIAGNTFATIEVFSRFKLGETVVYSQRNFLHFLMEEDAKGLGPIPQTPIPADWPKLVFPEGSYNGMPFRGLQTGQSVTFGVAGVAKNQEPTGGYLVDAKPTGLEPSPIAFNPSKDKYSLSPATDPSLNVVASGPMGGSGKAKTSVAVLPLQNENEVLTFSLQVTLSRWSYRKLNFGLGLVAFAGIATTVIVNKKRKKFKFNKFNQES